MGRTALEIATDAADVLGLDRVGSLFSPYDEGDTSNRKLRWALIRTLDHLNKRQDWQVQRREFVFTWVGPGEFVLAPVWRAADFGRFVPNTMFSRSRGWRLDGPVTPSEWQNFRTFGSAVWGSFRIAGDEFLVNPAPGNGHVFAYEYMSKSVCTGVDGIGKPRPTLDTDTFPWSDMLLTLGVVYFHRREERLDYATNEIDFESAITEEYRMDGHRRVIDMASLDRDSGDAMWPGNIDGGTGHRLGSLVGSP